MKKYINQQTITTLLGFFLLLLKNQVIELTKLDALIVIVVIGVLLGFGYTLENLGELVGFLPKKEDKKEKEEIDVNID